LLDDYFVFFVPEKRPLLHRQALNVLYDLYGVDPVDQDDRVAGVKTDNAIESTIVGVELDIDDPTLNDEHLLQVNDRSRQLAVVVRLFGVPSLMGEQPKLE
jgi:hypothetical protein